MGNKQQLLPLFFKAIVSRRYRVRLRYNDDYSRIGTAWQFGIGENSKKGLVIYSKSITDRVCFTVWLYNGG